MKYIGSFTEAEYDIRSRMWLISAPNFSILESWDKEIFPPPKSAYQKQKEHMSSIIVLDKKEITGIDEIGAGLKLAPYDYQKEVIKFAYDVENCLIIAPCGAGKTPMAIALYDECRRRGKINGTGIIVVKASLKAQWKAEVRKFSDYSVRIIETLAKTKDDNSFKEQFENIDLLICNYETLNDERVRKELHRIKPEFVFLDEIHYIRTDSTKRAKSCYEFNDAKIKAGATATPLQRDPRDIFGIFKFINPEVFPKKGAFDSLYIKWGSYGRVSGSKNEKKLNEKISPYTIIKSKEEVAKQLPKLFITQRYCDMHPVQVEVHQLLMEELDQLHEQEKKLTGGLPVHLVERTPELEKVEAGILMRQTFAQELCVSEQLLIESDSNAAKKYVTGKPDSKMDLLIELLEEILDSGEKVAVFSRYKKMQDVITERIQKEAKKNKLFNMKIAYVNGTLNGDDRYANVVKFRDDPSCKLLLLSDAGAEGISLGWCSYLIEMDLANSYAIQTQRHGRIQRADSVSDTAHVYQLIANDSYDEIALKIINKKEKYDSQIVHGEGLDEDHFE